jgi:uncharacterized Zn finger protein (UPF0148 family)
MSSGIVATEDLKECPGCGAPATRIGDRQRICNGCGLDWIVVTPEDELEAEAERKVRGREHAEEHGRGRPIAKEQLRW